MNTPKEKFCSCPGNPVTDYKTRITCVSNDGVVSCMHCGLPLHPVIGKISSPPQNVGEVLEKVDQQVGGALRALGGMKPTQREEEKECVCGHWESRHRPFCDVGDNADKCPEFVSVEKEDEALLKIAEERDKDFPDTKE